jgi:hypothetical protein
MAFFSFWAIADFVIFIPYMALGLLMDRHALRYASPLQDP